MAGLTHRVVEAELMDDPSLAPDVHRRALRGLSRINRVSGCGRILWRAVERNADPTAPQPSILDIATGSGDVPLALWRRAQHGGRRIRLSGVDISVTAIDTAIRRAADSGADIEYRQLDVLRAPLPAGFDFITCSLFLHHLDREQAIDLLRAMRDAAEIGVIVNDLRRCRAGLAAAQVGCRLLTRSRIVHTDGPRSVRAAFSLEEARQLANDAEMDGSIITRTWPWRWLLIWKRTQDR